MVNVKEVFITKEVAEMLDLNTSYLIRLAKKLQGENLISEQDMRLAGKSNYIFNENAIKIIKGNLKRK